MGTQERRQREKEQLRERILDTARELFVRDGYENVSMRKIADAIEYSPTAIYLHFADKQALMRELCGRDFDRLAGAFQHLAVIADPVQRIRQTGLAYIRFGTEHANHYRLMFMTRHAVKPEPQRLEALGNPDADAYAFLFHAVVAAMEAGRFREDLTDPQLVAQTLWATVHGVASLHITKGDDPWMDWATLEARASLACSAVLRGLLRDPSTLEEAP